MCITDQDLDLDKELNKYVNLNFLSKLVKTALQNYFIFVVSYNNTKILHTVIGVQNVWKYEEWKIRSGHQLGRKIERCR